METLARMLPHIESVDKLCKISVASLQFPSADILNDGCVYFLRVVYRVTELGTQVVATQNRKARVWVLARLRNDV
jgi:hypothetical protein